MTALAAVYRFERGPEPAQACARMLAAQRRYGSDTDRVWSGGDVAMGRRLQPLLPQDAFDRQPLTGGGGRFVLIADVRIDNRDELADALQMPAPAARDLCDAAILLAAFERWAEDCLDRILGDYAFAVWHASRRRLLLARDPLGQRPLHYHAGNGFFALASMPMGLHALAEVPYRPDVERLAEFLALVPESGSRTFFQGIERVEPGHILTVMARNASARRYWQPAPRRSVIGKPDDYAQALRQHLDRAVRSRLRGASDVGAHLSAGLDSSAVAATAARQLAPSGRVVAFTAVPRAGFEGATRDGRIIDEGPHAAATAAMYPNMEHVLIRTPGHSPLDDLDRSFALFDRPLPSICNMVWLFAVNDAVRERGLTVLLNGQMGNVGMSYSGAELLCELFLGGHLLRWRREASALVAQGASWRSLLARTLAPWRLDVRPRNRGLFAVLGYAALVPDCVAAFDLDARVRARNPAYGGRGWKDGLSMRLWTLRHVDPGNFNKGVLAGWRIDLRDPLADRRLIEFCLAIPTAEYFRAGMQRSLARRALEDRLPECVLQERRIGYQAADWHEGLSAARDRVAAELARLDACGPASELLDLPRLHRLVQAWPGGGWHRHDVTQLYRGTLLRALSAGHFLRRAAERRDA